MLLRSCYYFVGYKLMFKKMYFFNRKGHKELYNRDSYREESFLQSFANFALYTKPNI